MNLGQLADGENLFLLGSGAGLPALPGISGFPLGAKWITSCGVPREHTNEQRAADSQARRTVADLGRVVFRFRLGAFCDSPIGWFGTCRVIADLVDVLLAIGAGIDDVVLLALSTLGAH